MISHIHGAELPRFSVVVPAYQAASTLAETLDAILEQTFGDWECVVVDDGSTDDTLRIALEYAARDLRIRVVHQENQGTAGAYNAGVSSATGDFVVICSADDILLPEHLSRMSAFIDSEDGYDIYSSNGYFWSPGDSRQLCYGPGQGERIHSLELGDVIRRCFFSVGAAYRRELFATVGGYRLGVYGEDYDFWLRAMASGARHRYLPEALSLHRVSPTQKSAHLETVYRSDIRLISDLRRDFQLSAADSRAVDESIRDREHLIAELNRPWRLYQNLLRPAAKRIVFGLLGRQRAQHLLRVLKSMIGRGGPR
jgi:glycosyltransferase involved in cell wall biosynthesis